MMSAHRRQWGLPRKDADLPAHGCSAWQPPRHAHSPLSGYKATVPLEVPQGSALSSSSASLSHSPQDGKSIRTTFPYPRVMLFQVRSRSSAPTHPNPSESGTLYNFCVPCFSHQIISPF